MVLPVRLKKRSGRMTAVGMMCPMRQQIMSHPHHLLLHTRRGGPAQGRKHASDMEDQRRGRLLVRQHLQLPPQPGAKESGGLSPADVSALSASLLASFAGRTMTRLEAVIQVLRLHGKPLYYDVLTRIALKLGLIRFTGSQGTAGESMKAFLNKTIRERKCNLLVNVGKGVYGLREWFDLQPGTPPVAKATQAAPANSAAAKPFGSEGSSSEAASGCCGMESDETSDGEEDTGHRPAARSLSEAASMAAIPSAQTMSTGIGDNKEKLQVIGSKVEEVGMERRHAATTEDEELVAVPAARRIGTTAEGGEPECRGPLTSSRSSPPPAPLALALSNTPPPQPSPPTLVTRQRVAASTLAPPPTTRAAAAAAAAAAAVAPARPSSGSPLRPRHSPRGSQRASSSRSSATIICKPTTGAISPPPSPTAAAGSAWPTMANMAAKVEAVVAANRGEGSSLGSGWAGALMRTSGRRGAAGGCVGGVEGSRRGESTPQGPQEVPHPTSRSLLAPTTALPAPSPAVLRAAPHTRRGAAAAMVATVASGCRIEALLN